ncbi:MAG: Hcp family type VI secretion system effector [Thermodesulfobacteriota bacterium]|nr:Hcp family type VI secretion system effector [Thermodesulfobacteriota bacterium]
MSMPSHLSVTGKNQGKIEGSCEIKGREGTILVYALDHVVTIPSDPGTGQPTGKRIHKPMTVTKEIDKSSPKLYQGLTSGEQLSEVVLDFYRISPTGTEEKYFTTKLETAIIVSMEAFYPETFLSENEAYKHMEKVSFTYEKIIWTWQPDGIEAEDSWKAPKE